MTKGNYLTIALLISLVVVISLFSAADSARALDKKCKGWTVQLGPQSDTSGLKNINYPEASTTTYWTTRLQASIGSILEIHGRFPFCRFTALEIYSGDQLIDHLNDIDIVPDPGENNPFVSGTANGTYTAYVVFGEQPANPPPNTLYSGTLTSVILVYRIYHATNPADPAGSATAPVLPDLSLNGTRLPSCEVLPFIADEDSTAWGRLDNGDWIGTPPTAKQKLQAADPPVWSVGDPYARHYFPNGANYYMGTMLSRQFMQPNTANSIYVMRFLAPTYPKTRSGEPVHSDRQVRFWSVCTDDPYTTNVNRCIPDDKALLDGEGYATFVISDPGAKPSDAALTAFSANWLPWGALQLPTDVVFDRTAQAWGVGTPVHYYNWIVYRQTLARPSFAQSFEAVSQLPRDQQRAAMGDYWPVGGYCATADFNSFGFACLAR